MDLRSIIRTTDGYISLSGDPGECHNGSWNKIRSVHFRIPITSSIQNRISTEDFGVEILLKTGHSLA